MLQRLLQSTDPTPQRTAALTTLAATVIKGGQDQPVHELLQWVAPDARPAWQREALLAGIEATVLGGPLPGSPPPRAPAPAAASSAPGGRGGPGGARAFPDALPGSGGGRGRGGAMTALTREPRALAALAGAGGEAGTRAARILERMTWPGKPPVPGAAPAAAPLTAAQQDLIASGQTVYASLCIACHQEDGRGRERLAPTLIGSALTLAAPQIPIRILLNGKEGDVGLMPPLGTSLSDEQIAGVLSYIRRQWGNSAAAVDVETVQQVRALSASRTRPWTTQELLALEAGAPGGRP